jgi:predicted phage terminase large subunit-like protein
MASTKISKALEKMLRNYEEHCRSIEQITHVNANETPAERRKTRLELEKDYVSWFQAIFPKYAEVPSAWFHKKLAKIIIKKDVVNVLAEIYRSGAKSVHLDLGIPMYLYVTGKLHFMLLVGQTENKAKKLISDIQAQLSHNRKFIHYYGKKFKFGDWSNGDFTTTDGVKFMAIGAGQSPRGLREANQRPDYIIIDDIDTAKRCQNDDLSGKLLEWAWEDLRGTFNEGGKYRRFIVANNNFHKNTLINQLKVEFEQYNQRARENNFKKEHYIVSVTAVKDLETFEPNWPEKTSAKYWRKKFLTTPYRSFMREYMHKHIIEGAIFKNEQIHYKPRKQFRSYDALVFYGDLSYKDAGDYKAMVLMGKTGREFHVLDCFVRQTSRNNVAVWLYDFVEDNQLLKSNVKYLVEGLFAQDEFVNDFDLEGDVRGWYIPVVADKKTKAGKFDRIESMAGYFERGNVFFNEQLEKSPDCKELINQLLAFQKGSGAHDDAPDAMQSCIGELNVAAIINSVPPKVTSRKDWINKSKNRY